MQLASGHTILSGHGAPFSPAETLDPTADAAVRDNVRGIGENAFDNGAVSSRALREASQGAPEDAMETMVLESAKDGTFLDTPEFAQEFTTFVEEIEGFESVAYDDHQLGSQWHSSKKKGDPTIGFGFNLNSAGADAMLANAGLDKQAILKGKPITRQQAESLLKQKSAVTATWLKKHFKGVPVSGNQWTALMSLAYNSRWDKNGPTLIGPKLTKAIKDGDLETAANEIEFNSTGGAPKAVKRGLEARRRYEALVFRGASLEPEL
jgi:GH24 family phage-related lysozyme (muramidase)